MSMVVDDLSVNEPKERKFQQQTMILNKKPGIKPGFS